MAISADTKMTAKVLMARLSRTNAARSIKHRGEKGSFILECPALTPGTPLVRFGLGGCPNIRHCGKRVLRAGRWQGLDASRNESRSRLIVSAEAEMSDYQREIYHSENGDRWLLCRDDDGRVFVLHKANMSSGGAVTKIELGDFLGRGKAGPEHQALTRLIGSLVDGD